MSFRFFVSDILTNKTREFLNSPPLIEADIKLDFSFVV